MWVYGFLLIFCSQIWLLTLNFSGFRMGVYVLHIYLSVLYLGLISLFFYGFYYMNFLGCFLVLYGLHFPCVLGCWFIQNSRWTDNMFTVFVYPLMFLGFRIGKLIWLFLGYCWFMLCFSLIFLGFRICVYARGHIRASVLYLRPL